LGPILTVTWVSEIKQSAKCRQIEFGFAQETLYLGSSSDPINLKFDYGHLSGFAQEAFQENFLLPLACPQRKKLNGRAFIRI